MLTGVPKSCNIVNASSVLLLNQALTIFEKTFFSVLFNIVDAFFVGPIVPLLRLNLGRNIMKDKSFAILQRVGRSFMLPIAILPVAGLLLGIGGSFTNATMISAYHLESILGEGTVLNALLTVMSNCGNIIFANLPIIFCHGCGNRDGYKTEKSVAALAAAISFFVMHTAINTMGTITGGFATLPDGSVTTTVGIQTLQMGVFGGIIVGLGVSYLHNKYYKMQLPQVLSFFGGTRFVPIVSAGAYVLIGILMYFIWPFIQSAIYSLGDLVRGTGYFGTFIYGLIERALIPFGLHHVFYLPFWQTGVGGNNGCRWQPYRRRTKYLLRPIGFKQYNAILSRSNSFHGW